MTNERNVLAEWRESAAFWDRHAATVRRLMMPITDALLAQTQISAGQRVLDVAGGTGEPALTIAAAVGPEGHVVCTDAVAEMVAVAERFARELALENAEFKNCSADSLPFDDEAFDAVVCRLGAMFFPDVEAALREMLRVLRPGGLVGLAVWSDRTANPFFSIVTDVLASIAPSPPEDPDAPGAFRFSEPGKLSRLLRNAGAAAVTERLVDFRMEATLTPADFWRLRREISDSLRKKVALLTPDQLERASREVQSAILPFAREGRLSLPAQVIVVTARKDKARD